MHSAEYGRMRVGRCIPSEAYGSMGCRMDVLGQMDLLCSGRHSCEVKVSSILDTLGDNSPPCLEQLRGYMEASYSCVKGKWQNIMVIISSYSCYQHKSWMELALKINIPPLSLLHQVYVSIIDIFLIYSFCFKVLLLCIEWFYSPHKHAFNMIPTHYKKKNGMQWILLVVVPAFQSMEIGNNMHLLSSPVVTAPKDSCSIRDHGTMGHKGIQGGYIANIVTEATSCGSLDRPWLLEAPSGQNIKITLHDFNVSSRDPDQFVEGIPQICQVLAVIKENAIKSSETICASISRNKWVYTSVTNSMEIRIVSKNKNSYFLLEYEGESYTEWGITVGCRPLMNLPLEVMSTDSLQSRCSVA